MPFRARHRALPSVWYRVIPPDAERRTSAKTTPNEVQNGSAQSRRSRENPLDENTDFVHRDVSVARSLNMTRRQIKIKNFPTVKEKCLTGDFFFGIMATIRSAE